MKKEKLYLELSLAEGVTILIDFNLQKVTTYFVDGTVYAATPSSVLARYELALEAGYEPSKTGDWVGVAFREMAEHQALLTMICRTFWNRDSHILKHSGTSLDREHEALVVKAMQHIANGQNVSDEILAGIPGDLIWIVERSLEKFREKFIA